MDKSTAKNFFKVGAGLLFLAFILFRFSVFQAGVSVVLRIITPFIIGGLIALFVSVPLEHVEVALRRFVFKDTDKKGIYRTVALIITIVLILIFMYFAISAVVPQMVNAIIGFVEALPRLVNSVITQTEEFIMTHFDEGDLEIGAQFEEDIRAFSNTVKSNIQGAIKSIFIGGVQMVSSTINFIVTTFLALAFAIYLIFYKETFGDQIRRALYAFLSDNAAKVVLITGKRAQQSFSNFISGVTFSSIIYGIANFIGMVITGLPYKTTMSFVAVFLNFIPYFGPFLTGFVGFVLISVVSFKQGIIFVILTVILQQLEGNVLYPKIMGEQVGLPGIWVMVSVTVGASIMGLFGMILSVPVVTVIYQTLGDVVKYKRLKKEEDEGAVEKPLQLSEVMNQSLLQNIANPEDEEDDKS